MALIAQLKLMYLEFVASLFNEELVDEQFAQVKNSKVNNPRFDPATMESKFLKESERLMNSMADTLFEQPVVNLETVYKLAQHLKGSSSIFGAAKIKNICAGFPEQCKNSNVEMLRICVHQLRNEKLCLMTKLDELRKIEDEIVAAGGTIPIIELKSVVRGV